MKNSQVKISYIKIISFTGLILTLIPSILVYQGDIDLEMNKMLMLIGNFCWFLTAPYWMNKNQNR